MKRHWSIYKYFDRLTFVLYIELLFPNEEDYYDSQYTFSFDIFGFNFSINTWKE